MRLLIVIPHFQKNNLGEKLIANCLRNLAKHEPQMLAHTLVIDDASPHNATLTFKELQKTYPCRFAVKHKNTTYSDIINQGIDYALQNKYDFACLMNNDIEVVMPFVQRIADVSGALKAERLGIIGPVLLYPSGRLQSAGIEITDYMDAAREMEKKVFYADTILAKRTRYVQAVTGAMQFVNLEMVKEIGMYSTNYSLSYEDVEFCIRAWQHDWKVLLESKLVAIHAESTTRGYAIGEKEMASLEQFSKDKKTWDMDAIRQKILTANALHQAQ
jgi:GT2 family glycosyltransferase